MALSWRVSVPFELRTMPMPCWDEYLMKRVRSAWSVGSPPMTSSVRTPSFRSRSTMDRNSGNAMSSIFCRLRLKQKSQDWLHRSVG
jgi:hypothetical protein